MTKMSNKFRFLILLLIKMKTSVDGQCSVQSETFENDFCTMKTQMDMLVADDSKVTAVQSEVAKLWHALQSETAKVADSQNRLAKVEKNVDPAAMNSSKFETMALHAEVMEVTRQTNERIHNLTSLIISLKIRLDMLESSCMACTMAKHPCSSSPCQNGGQCIEVNGSYFCICDLQYAGKNCEQTDHCHGVVCQNDGTCVSDTLGSSCTCAPEFTGPKCESKLDACFSSPCVHGLCFLDKNTSFVCLCNDGYTGTTCAIDSTGSNQTTVPQQITTMTTTPTTTRPPRMCANGHSCNDPAICIDQGPTNFTCECPPTKQTINDNCFEPFYYKDFDWCCVKDICNTTITQPICPP